jgi:hypothetical protein
LAAEIVAAFEVIARVARSANVIKNRGWNIGVMTIALEWKGLRGAENDFTSALKGWNWDGTGFTG